jgi:thiol-disulfide isomerase/thioredoxin
MAFLMRRALLVALLVIALLPREGWSLDVGDPAPDATLADWEGKAVRLQDLRGQTVCVDFWASWCATCAAALPELDAVARRYRGAAVQFLAVNVDRDLEKASSFLEFHLPSPALRLLRDPGGELLSRFGAPAMPSLYLIDASGVIRMVGSGYTEESIGEMERILSELLETREDADRRP